MEPFTKFLEFAAKYAWSLFVVCCFVLVIPEDAAVQIGLSKIRAEFKGYFWLVAIFTGMLSLGAFFSYIDQRVFGDWLGQRIRDRERKRKRATQLEGIVKRLDSLNAREQLWLKYCLYHNEQTLSGRMDDPTAQSLLNKKILSQGSGSMLDLPFHIPDDLWAHLKENRHQFLSEKELSNRKFEEHLRNFRRSLWPEHWR